MSKGDPDAGVLAGILTSAADYLDHPPIRPGAIVRYVHGPAGTVLNEDWQRRIGRTFVVVEVDQGSVSAWDPEYSPATATNAAVGGRIWFASGRIDVIVPKRNRELALWLRALASELRAGWHRSDGAEIARAVTVAQAILDEATEPTGGV